MADRERRRHWTQGLRWKIGNRNSYGYRSGAILRSADSSHGQKLCQQRYRNHDMQQDTGPQQSASKRYGNAHPRQ